MAKGVMFGPTERAQMRAEVVAEIVAALRQPERWKGWSFREQHWVAAADLIEREFGSGPSDAKHE